LRAQDGERHRLTDEKALFKNRAQLGERQTDEEAVSKNRGMALEQTKSS
jgi:hypothetical protein